MYGGGREPALALMTSGSTGGPKICLHSHHAFVAFDEAVTRRAWGIVAGDRVLGSSGLYFSFGLQGIHAPLSAGATAILLPQFKRHTDFLAAIEQERASVFLAVPTLYHLLWTKAARSHQMASLRLSLSAGEKLPPLVRERWRAFSGSSILESIGTTETFSPYFTEYLGEGEGLQAIAGFRYRTEAVAAKNRHNNICTVSVSSGSMMLGYANETDSVASVPDEWFHTNDLFTRQDDRYRFVARASEMAKVAGYWVAPLQLEEALLRLPGVAMAAAVPVTTEVGLTRLRAFVVLNPATVADRPEWTQAAESALATSLRPKALRPDRIEVVPALPTTPSGKLLRRSLLSLCGNNFALPEAG